jgi:ubiquinone/menaquinone biosynthesis C-methylase UbiE
MDEHVRKANTDEFYAETYDASVSDWPGEIDFYREMADKAKSGGGAILEVACGTGRVAIRLAGTGARVVGIDLSPQMLEVARRNSTHISNARWIEADMRSFQLTERFNLALIPGHAFQNLNTTQDQAACLNCVRSHLRSGGILVVHLDHMNTENMKWLGALCGDQRGVFDTAEQFLHPETGRQVRASRAWSYEPATQTAVVQTAWDEIGPEGQTLTRIEREPIRLHCVFRFEMEHLLARVGLEVEAVYGDFLRHELEDDSPSMIWVARRP